MKVKKITTKAEGNEFFPLPPDYDTLTDDGQRQARVNACRQWLVPTKVPSDKALRFVASVLFFDHWYLFPDEQDDFNPMFYDEDPVPIPDGHLGIYKEWANSRASITIAPRGFAKSNCIRKAILLQMMTRPGYSFIYATSTNDNAKQTGQILKTQFTENARLQEDWMPEFPDNRIIPKRGEASFGIEMMYLKNGSWFRAISAESRQRGGRPRCYVLDDPEYDPRASTSMSVLRSYMDNLLFKVVMPMVTRPDTSIRWLATFVSRRHYAWYAMDTQETEKGTRAKDPRFDHWNRMVIKAAYHDEQDKLVSCWPEMWPVDRKMKNSDPRLKERISLEEVREMIGSANFASEYMADPGSSDDVFFPPLETQHSWSYSNVDELLGDEPWASMTSISWQDVQGKERSKPLSNFLEESWLFMTIDTSYTATRDSDFKVCTVLAATPDNELFVLDIWSGQCDENTLIKEVFKMADKWHVPSIRPEVVKQSISLYQNLDSIVKQRATEMVNVSFLPKVVPLKVGMVSKEARIAALQFRFENGLIKFPLERRMDRHWKDLFDQIEQFNPEVKDGGLSKDDHIDTVAMSGAILKGRIARREEEYEDDRTPEEHILDGDLTDESGVPYAYRMKGISIDLINQLEENHGSSESGHSRV